jgi:general secretion pathway protein L
MTLRLLVPPLDRPGPDTPFAWCVTDGRGTVQREGSSVLAGVPRGDAVDVILPASRVLSARLKLPKVGASTLRELLPFAIEDRLLADPAQVHAVPGATNARGETLVAVVDRAWLEDVLALLARADVAPARLLCETALLPVAPGQWSVVLGPGRSFLVEDDGHAVAFDPPPGGEPPLSVRIAVDEASERSARPDHLRVLVEPGVPPPDAHAWSARTGVRTSLAEAGGLLAAPVAANAIDLLAGDFGRRTARLGMVRVPRLAWALAGAIVALQFAFTAADAWRLERERRSLESEREALFRTAFPEARTVVDPALQMRRNLADLQRTRGQAAASDFLALATAAAKADPQTARRLAYANGRLEIDRGGAGK